MESLAKIFNQIINMGITASYVILAVLAVRLVFSHLPKKYSYYLWGIVGFRLICPVSFSSVFSMFNLRMFDSVRSRRGMEYVPENIGYAQKPAVNTGIPAVDMTINKSFPAATPEVSVNPMQVIMWGLSFVWILGIAALLIYSIASYLRLKKQVKAAVLLKENIYECDNLATPFVLGILVPKIYIPFRLAEEERHYILEHERYHIRRRDYLIKIAAFLITAVYWFHPLVWLSYFLMCRDMEMSCDEKVISDMGIEIKKAYSTSLLSFSTNHRQRLVSPLAFGESGAGKRVKNVLRFRKPGKLLTAVGVVLLLLLLVVCASNGKSGEWVKGTLDKSDLRGTRVVHKYQFDKEAKTYVLYADVLENGTFVGRQVLLCEEITPENLKMEASLSIFNEGEWCIYAESKTAEGDNSRFLKYDIPADYFRGGSFWLYDGKKQEINLSEHYVMTAVSLGAEAIMPVKIYRCEEWMDEEKWEYLMKENEDNTVILFKCLVSSKARQMDENGHFYLEDENGVKIKEEGIFLDEQQEMDLTEKKLPEKDTGSEQPEETNETTPAEKWAAAFCDRNGETIQSIASEETLASMEEQGYLMREDDYISVGWSSPWPMELSDWKGAGINSYRIISESNTNGRGQAEILYYAWTSDPHIWVWRETIAYEEKNGALQVTSEELKEMNYIASAEEFYQAYPDGVISGTLMDYQNNGMGKVLNDAALLSSSTAYQDLFEPDTAARYLLNLLDNSNKVEITVLDETEENGTAEVNIHFAEDGKDVKITMIRPFGGDGIWIPQNR